MNENNGQNEDKSTQELAEMIRPGRSETEGNRSQCAFQSGEKVHIGAQLEPPGRVPTEDQILWLVIRNSTKALSFDNYKNFMDFLLCDKYEAMKAYKFNDDGGRFPDKAAKREFIENLRNELKEKYGSVSKYLKMPYTDSRAYSYLKVATEAFMIVNVGVDPMDVLGEMQQKEEINWSEESNRLGTSINWEITPGWWDDYTKAINGDQDESVLPYISIIMQKFEGMDKIEYAEGSKLSACYGLLKKKLLYPNFIELIWSYWHEEGMLVQSMNAISRRFQNVRNPAHKDPLANFELDPLRPLNNLLWGYIQDEQHRLSLVRRAYEYDHHYGFRLLGKAIPQMKPADSRFRFIEAFHHLLYVCTQFFTRDDDMTVAADGFPILNHLKEVHLLLNEGQHNQYGDLPWTARQEMLMEQWLLARPEMRTFLAGRIMVDNPEPWMDRVDTMKKLQGWTDTPVMHFRNLGVFGEQILLSVRFGAWSDIHDRERAANWARYWRSEIQSYIHAYRVGTGVELSSQPLQANLPAHHRIPSYHLQKRLDEQYKKAKA